MNKIETVLKGTARGFGFFDNTFKYRIFMVAVPFLFGYELLSATAHLSGVQWLIVGLFGICSVVLFLGILFVLFIDIISGVKNNITESKLKQEKPTRG